MTPIGNASILKNTHRSSWTCSLLLFAAVPGLITGCSDGADSPSASLPEAQDSIPALQITFPLAGSSADGVDTLTVSGLLQDLADGTLSAEDITAFQVNNVSPELNLATGRWSAAIPVEQGEVEIRAKVESRSGHRDTDTVRIGNTAPPANYDLIDVSPDGNTLHVVTASAGGLLRSIDLTNNTASVVSQGFVDDLSRYVSTGIRTDLAQDTAYFLRYSAAPYPIKPDAFSVDLESGSGQSRGALPFAQNSDYEFLYQYPDFDLDEQGKRLVLTLHADRDYDPSDDCWLSILDLDSGVRNDLVKGSQVGGPVGGFYPDLCPGPIVVDSANNRAIVAADNRKNGLVEIADFRGLYAYDLATGERYTIADESTGKGPELSAPSRLFRTSDAEKVLALDPSGVLEVDTTSGDREMKLANPRLPEEISDISFDETNNRLLIAHKSNTISALDLATGELTAVIAFSRAVGSGPEFSSLLPGVMDSANQRILAVTRRGNALMSIELNTLERDVIASDLGVNDTFRMKVAAAVMNASGTKLYYAIDKSFIRQRDRGDIMVVDLQTGIVERISTNNSATGPELRRTRGLSLNAAGGLLYLTADYGRPARSGVLSVDIATGTRRLISSHTQGPDQIGATLAAHLYDSGGMRLIALTPEGAITAVDLQSGNRETLVQPSPEQRPYNFANNISWDTMPNTVLFAGSYRESPLTRLQSVNLLTGEREELKGDVYDFVFDSMTSRIFSSRDNVETRADELLAMDRDTPGSVVIARPE